MSQIQSDQTRARVPTTCHVCGRPLGSELWWMVEPPDIAEHESCRDWSRHAFPFERELRVLRGVARQIGRIRREVFRIGRLLSRFERRWPDGGLEVVERARRELAALRKKLAEAFDSETRPGRDL